jgi:hypothetical protein
MSARSILRISGWLAGSVFALLLANLFLVLFVSGTDIFLGQPPQFTLPLFSLFTVSAVLIAVHRSKTRAVDVVSDGSRARSATVRGRRRKAPEQVPAYLSMTIIRRPYVAAAHSPETNEWKGAIQ